MTTTAHVLHIAQHDDARSGLISPCSTLHLRWYTLVGLAPYVICNSDVRIMRRFMRGQFYCPFGYILTACCIRQPIENRHREVNLYEHTSFKSIELVTIRIDTTHAISAFQDISSCHSGHGVQHLVGFGLVSLPHVAWTSLEISQFDYLLCEVFSDHCPKSDRISDIMSS